MRRTMVRLALVMALLGPWCVARGQVDPSVEMEKDIRQLMDVTGAGNLAVQMMNQMLIQMEQAMPNVPEEFWARFMSKVDTDELIDLIVPVYAKHFTHDEIKHLLAFYRTPLGQKVIATLPAVMQESVMAGQKWGEQLGLQVAAELKAEGYQ